MSHPYKTARRFEIPGHARYLTFSCYHQLPLFNDDIIKDLYVQQLTVTHARLRFDLAAWVVMPEHIHLLLQPVCGSTVSQILLALKRPFAVRVLRRWRQLESPILAKMTDAAGRVHFWQAGGGYDRNIVTDGEYHEKIDYIHANPVRRGLVKRVTDWLWSSARWYDGDRTSGPVLTQLG